jgi:hypothetical protein
MPKKQTDPIPLNQDLINLLAPMGLEIKRNSVVIGENTGRVYGIVKYPQKVDVGWLSRITNMPGTVVSIGFKPVDNGALISAISKAIIQQRGIADSAKDPLTRQRAEKAAEDGERIMLQIDREGETVGLMSVTISPLVREDRDFIKACRRVESNLGVLKCKGRVMVSLQKEGFQNLSPAYPLNDIIGNIVERIVPLSTFIGGFPFASSGFNDGTGYYFAKDMSDSLIVLDPWKRGGDRTNTNFVIMGVAGVGKSTAIKHIALAEMMKGTKIIFVDVEREYKDLCQAVKGDWINAGGGSSGMLNPLQIRPAPRDEDDEKDKLYVDEGNGMGPMALHMKTLEVFFSLYLPSLTDMHKAILKKSLVELYQQFGITWATDVNMLKPAQFPIFSDLYALIEKKAKDEKSGEIYTELALLLYDIAHGSDSFLWNGHTTIDPQTNCICLDTHDLQETSDSVKRTQYFNLLTYCWELMSRDRNERVLLIADEAYMLIDPNVPQSLIFMRNVEKRARKYEAGLAIISHSVVDFLDPSVKMYGQALLDIPCMKIVMGTDGRNLQETAELYNLTEAETELLAAKKRKHALFMVGSKRLHIQFDIPDYKFAYMGSAGGR